MPFFMLLPPFAQKFFFRYIFSSIAYFLRFFKGTTHSSPTRFRQILQLFAEQPLLLSYLTLSAFRKQQTLRRVIFPIKKALQISLESFVFLMDLRTGMRFCVYIFQLLIRQLRINLRGGNIGMTQHFLHRAQVRTVFD